MALNNANQPISESISLGSISANSVLPAMHLSRRAAIKAAWLINGAAVSGGTDKVSVVLQNQSGPLPLASIDSSVVPLVADVASPLASLVAPQAGTQGGFPPSTGYPIDVPAGSDLQVAVTVAGAGVLTNAKLIVEYYPL